MTDRSELIKKPEHSTAVLWRSRLRSDVQAMQAYVVQPSDGLIKLDAMENPFQLPTALQAALGQRLGALSVNRYPDASVRLLKQELATYVDLPDGFGLMLGNGSDELISLISLVCAVPGASVLAPVPGFVMYGLSAKLLGLTFHGVPLTADFELDEPAMEDAIAKHQPSVVYLAHPNNPTANLWSIDVIGRLIQAVGGYGGLVVMDEAYQPFSSRSWLERMRADPESHRHVLLMRTLSKFGLAGARLGYLLGAKELVSELDKVRPPYNVSTLNAECARFAIEHAEVFTRQAGAIKQQRGLLLEAMRQMQTVQVWDSQANMLLMRVPDAHATFVSLKAQGVLIKNVSALHPLLAQCLRITVGTPEENLVFLAALKRAL
jgi:histidinol-phosphate aminotransferase